MVCADNMHTVVVVVAVVIVVVVVDIVVVFVPCAGRFPHNYVQASFKPLPGMHELKQRILIKKVRHAMAISNYFQEKLGIISFFSSVFVLRENMFWQAPSRIGSSFDVRSIVGSEFST